MSQAQAQKDRRMIVPSEAFFEYLRYHKDLAKTAVNELVNDIRIEVWRRNINDGDKTFFLVSLGGLKEAFRLLIAEIELAEGIEDYENLETLNEALTSLIKFLIKTYYNIKEDLEPFDRILTDVYHNLEDSVTILLDAYMIKLRDKILKLKSEKS